jgi:hypothetical protein
MSPAKRNLRSAEYRALADKAAALAAASPLDNVREKHTQAALQWTQLADMDDRRNADPAPAGG